MLKPNDTLKHYDDQRYGLINIKVTYVYIYYPQDGNPYYKGKGYANIDGELKMISFTTHNKHFYY